jgi:protein tyrosine phosphatase (PTP) superfamily phosphohydrolase (DUF442 family)
MRNLRRKSTGGPVEGAPVSSRPAGRAIRPLAVACLAVATFGLVGCQSGPCGGGPCGGGLFNGVKNGVRSAGDTIRGASARVFHHKSTVASGECCGGGVGVVEGMPVEGPIVPGGSMIPGPVVAPPINEQFPTILEPAPPTGSSTGTKGKTSSAVPSQGLKDLGNRQSSYSRGGSIESNDNGRGNNLARAAITPPADRSAGGAGGRSNLLDNVPPVDLDEEITRRVAKAPSVPLEAELVKTPKSDPDGPEILDDSLFPPIKAKVETSLSPGLKHFSSVKPNINGGSLPNADGLDWLKERGTKTLIDLRDATDVDPVFVEQVKSRGIRHISLPIDLNRLDSTSVARFSEEVNRASGQPVYFFDRDGTRAGVLWYVHRLTVDKVDPQLASREAEELGLKDKAAWVAAAKYLDTVKTATPRPMQPCP